MTALGERSSPTGWGGTVRKIAKAVAALVALGVVGVAGFFWYIIDQDRKDKVERDAVTVSAFNAPSQCGTMRPILVRTVSNASRTVKLVRLDVDIFEEGRSDSLGTERIEATNVVRPGGSGSSCWAIPALRRFPTANIHIRAEKSWVGFYADQDFIPPDPPPSDRPVAAEIAGTLPAGQPRSIPPARPTDPTVFAPPGGFLAAPIPIPADPNARVLFRDSEGVFTVVWKEALQTQNAGGVPMTENEWHQHQAMRERERAAQSGTVR